MGIGTSVLRDSYDAGADAVEKALKQLGNKNADAFLVFAAPAFDQKKMMKGVVSVSKKIPLIGGTTAGEISPKGLSVNSVVALALSSKDIRFHVGMGENISRNELKAGEQLARSALKGTSLKDAKTLLMFPDGLAGDGVRIVEGAKKVLGDNFEIVGGALGDEADFKQTYQYYNGKVYQDVVVGMLVSSKKSLKTSTGVMSGWEPIGSILTCTKAKANKVYEFNGKKALDVYRELLGKERGQKLPAIGLEYPMGLIDERAVGSDYFQIRAPLSIDEKEGSVTFAAAIPEGKRVTLTYSSRSTVINGSKRAAMQAKEILKGDPKLILMFSCVARKMVLGRRTDEEINAVKQVFGIEVPIFGFYTYGEIGPIDKRFPTLKSTRWHNETVVIYAIGA